MVLTTKQLREMKACRAGMRKFRELFGDEMNVNLANLKKIGAWGTTGDETEPPIRICPVEKADGALLYWLIATLREEGRQEFRGSVFSRKMMLLEHSADALRSRFAARRCTKVQYVKDLSLKAMKAIMISHEKNII